MRPTKAATECSYQRKHDELSSAILTHAPSLQVLQILFLVFLTLSREGTRMVEVYSSNFSFVVSPPLLNSLTRPATKSMEGAQ